MVSGGLETLPVDPLLSVTVTVIVKVPGVLYL